MKQKIKDKLKNNNKSFQEHVYNVLHNSNIRKILHYMAIYIMNIYANSYFILGDHRAFHKVCTLKIRTPSPLYAPAGITVFLQKKKIYIIDLKDTEPLLHLEKITTLLIKIKILMHGYINLHRNYIM